MVKKLIASSKKQRASVGDPYEELKNALLEGLSKTLGLKPPRNIGFGINTHKGRASYAKIYKFLESYGVSVSDFVWFVCQEDWTKVGCPSIYLLGCDAFLDRAAWYFTNKEKLRDMEFVLAAYDRVFGKGTGRRAQDLQLARGIHALCEELGYTVDSFFAYARSRFRKTPSFSFLASAAYLEEFKLKQKISTPSLYLDKVLEGMSRIPSILKPEELEEYNWQVAESVLEPLFYILSENGTCRSLKELAYRAVKEKGRPIFGAYFIDWQGKLTPLAVSCILYASQHLPRFGSSESWQYDIVPYISEFVDKGVFRKNVSVC